MKNITPIIIVAILAIAGTTIYSQNQKKQAAVHTDAVMEKTDDAMMQKDDIMEKMDDDAMMESHSDDAMMQNDDVMMKQDEAMTVNDDKMMNADDAIQKTSGDFIDYEGTDIASLSGDIVLDFSAPWCPSCRNFEKNVKENMDAIPSDLTIVKVDYDSNTDLRAKYGVRVQHTFVQIDNAGNKIALWTGGNDIESVVSNLQ